MEDEYTLVRSPVIDKTKWIEKLKYDVLRFSLDSIDLNLVEVGNAVNIQVRATLVTSRPCTVLFRWRPFGSACAICTPLSATKASR